MNPDDIVTVQFTRDALARFIALMNESNLTAVPGSPAVVTFRAEEYAPGQMRIAGTLHYPEKK